MVHIVKVFHTICTISNGVVKCYIQLPIPVAKPALSLFSVLSSLSADRSFLYKHESGINVLTSLGAERLIHWFPKMPNYSFNNIRWSSKCQNCNHCSLMNTSGQSMLGFLSHQTNTVIDYKRWWWVGRLWINRWHNITNNYWSSANCTL